MGLGAERVPIFENKKIKKQNSNLNPIKIGMDYDQYSQVQVLWVCLVQRRRQKERNFNRGKEFD